MANAKERLLSLIKKAASSKLREQANNTSLITITNVELSKDGKNATVYISVIPDEKEVEALSFCERKSREIRDTIKKSASLRVIPRVACKIDKGEKNRRRIEELLK